MLFILSNIVFTNLFFSFSYFLSKILINMLYTCTWSCITEVKSWREESKRKSANAEWHVGTVAKTETGEADIGFRFWSLTSWAWWYVIPEQN